MPEQLLTVLNLCMLALLYLFFVRVVRAVWTETKEPAVARAPKGRRPAKTSKSPTPTPLAGVPKRPSSPVLRGPAPAPPTATASAPNVLPTEIVAVSPIALAGTRHGLSAEVTVGRAPTATITIDDSYLSAVHSRIFRRGDHYMVEDLGSTNGTYVNRQKVTAAVVVVVGDRISTGNVDWDVR